MADEILVTKVRTEHGDASIDYNALANKPVDSKEEFELLMKLKQDANSAITTKNISNYLKDYALASDGSKYFNINKDHRPLVLTSGVHYGDELPEAGVVGQIFLKKV